MFLTLLSFVKFTGPSDEQKEYERFSKELKVLLAPLHQLIAMAPTDKPEDIELLGDNLSKEIRKFLEDNSDFFSDEASAHQSNKFISHKDNTINQLDTLKKQLRKDAFGENGSEEKRREFYQCIQAISELKKREKRKEEENTTAHHKKVFHKNRYKSDFWTF